MLCAPELWQPIVQPGYVPKEFAIEASLCGLAEFRDWKADDFTLRYRLYTDWAVLSKA